MLVRRGFFTVREKLEEGESHQASSENQALPNAAFVQKDLRRTFYGGHSSKSYY
ncbi:hypothetical protein V6Z11_A06G063800 [Gossypium hirsutum]|uniref:Uncharacterized protein n=1 Tax=Gossypium tomentosum TaxID=34277 RepID=A0A5D2Q345_GOSTO|nr:hypothetical protein ES332_A06G065100v1 [Gossypium tomentosum]